MAGEIHEQSINDEDKGNETNSHISHGAILKWMCAMLLQIYFKFRLSNAVLITFSGLIAHQPYEIFPTTLKGLYKMIGVTHMDMVIYTVFPNNKCKKLYNSIDAETSITCTNVILGKPCGHKFGYQRSLALK